MDQRETEQQLLLQAREGDYDAFGDLQVLIDPMLRRFIRRLIGMNDAEDDILQSVYIALFKKMHTIEPVSNFRAYLFQMTRNRCYDELRSLGRYESVSIDDDDAPAEFNLALTDVNDVPQSEEVAHWLLLQLEVQEAMNRLPEVQRQTLILYSEEEMSYAEIAEAMETTIGTVKSRLFYAKKTLRAHLRPEILQALDFEFGNETAEPAEKVAALD